MKKQTRGALEAGGPRQGANRVGFWLVDNSLLSVFSWFLLCVLRKRRSLKSLALLRVTSVLSG